MAPIHRIGLAQQQHFKHGQKMSNKIYLSKKIAGDEEFIRIDGKCYQRMGPSEEIPDHFAYQQTYQSCEDCEEDPGSSSSGSDTCCLCVFHSGPPQGTHATGPHNPGDIGPGCQHPPAPPVENYCTQLELSKYSSICVGDSVTATMTVTNTGPIAGVGGAPVYMALSIVAEHGGSLGWTLDSYTAGGTPNIGLSGFWIQWPELNLAPGESRVFEFTATHQECRQNFNYFEFIGEAARDAGWLHWLKPCTSSP